MSFDATQVVIYGISSVVGLLVWMWRWVDGRLKEAREQLAESERSCHEKMAIQSARMSAIESLQSQSAIWWARNHRGEFIRVSPAFVRVVGESCGYVRDDFVGHRPEHLTRLDPAFLARLQRLDHRARTAGAAAAHDVPIAAGVVATVIKVTSEGADGSAVYVGYAAVNTGDETAPPPGHGDAMAKSEELQ